MASFTLSGSSAQASSSTPSHSSSRLPRRTYPQFVPSGGENVAPFPENDHMFESLLRYFANPVGARVSSGACFCAEGDFGVVLPEV